MSPDPLLVVDGVSKRFGDLNAVQELSFEIAQGETFGLLGPNGAGKTTTISMICGLLRPDSGAVTVNGTPISATSTSGRELIGYVPQELALYLDLNGRENLSFFGRLYRLRGAELNRRIEEVLEIVGLTDRAKDRVSTYSGGMQRRLNIAAGMLHRPRLLILDEPTVGIDPQSRNAILDAVALLGTEGMSVLYTTHYMEEAERLCARVGIVDHGRLLACGTRRELVALVGESDSVSMTVDERADDVAAALTGLPGVRSATASDERTLVLVVDAAGQRLSSLIDAVEGTGASCVDIAVREPSLDSVFLHITGTALRD